MSGSATLDGADPRRWFVLATVCAALFAIPMDMTILYTGLPTLSLALGTSEPEKIWIVSIYSLVMAGLLPLCGNLADRYGSRTLLLAGIGVFGTGSLAAAFAGNPEILIAARAATGVGGAMVMPATVAIVALTFTDPRERTFALGIWNSVAAAGAATGPFIGGLLLEHFWWGAIFLVNVPIFVLLTPAALAICETPHKHAGEIDYAGAGLVMAGLVAMLWTLENLTAGHAPRWALGIATATAAIALTAFARRQLRSTSPLLDMRALADRCMGGGVFTALMSNIIMFGFMLVLTQYLQMAQGLSPLEAGLRTIPVFVGIFVIGPLAGRVVHRMGVGNQIAAAFAAVALAIGALAAGLPASTANPLVLTMILFTVGCGIGTATFGATIAIMHAAKAGRTAMTGSMQEVSFELGSAIGATLLGGLLAAGYVMLLDPPAGAVVPEAARQSFGLALDWLGTAPGTDSAPFHAAFAEAFRDVLFVAAGMALATAAAVRMIFSRVSPDR